MKPDALKKLLRPGLAAALLLSMSLAALAQDFKINDRVLAPWGGDYLAATIIGGPNYRGEWRVHFDKTDYSRDKWLLPADLKPYTELGELKPGDLIQVDILSAWNWVEVVEVKGDQVLCHKVNWTHEDDTWYPKDKLRRPPETETKPPAWNYPYFNGDFVMVNKGGPKPEFGRFLVDHDKVYVGDYLVTDMSRIVGKWTPRFKAGDVVRNRRGTRQWVQVRVDKPQPGNYDVTLVKTGQQDLVNEDTLAPEWDYDGFYALAAPLFSDQNPLKIDWLISTDKGQMNGFTVNDAQLKAGMDLLSRSESALKAKYADAPGTKDCYDCPAQLMDILARRKQVVMKACGLDVQTFVKNQIAGYQRHLDDARQQRFWQIPGSFGAVNLAAQVQAELRQNEADLAKDVARNKIIDPGFVFNYDRQAIIQAVSQDAAEFARLVPALNQVASNVSQFNTHDGSAESLATAYVRGIDPQARILGAATLSGGWKRDTSVSVNTSQTVATITRYLSTMVLVRTQSPKYKYPVVYSLTLSNEGKGGHVQPNSVLMAFYK